jgi:Fe-S-cluster containining protein
MTRYLTLYRGDKIRYRCQRSGRCCSTGPNVALTAYDICRIAKYMGVDWRELRGKYIIAIIADMLAIPALRGMGDGKCVFLEYVNGIPTCKIYPARPLRCRLYPFIPATPSNPNKIYVDPYCPGVGVGEEVEPPWKLLEEYYEEVRKHYTRMYELVFKEGYEPLEALEKLIDEVCEEAKKNPDWLKPEYLDKLYNK